VRTRRVSATIVVKCFDLCPDISTEQYPLGIISAEMNCILIPPQGGRHRMLTAELLPWNWKAERTATAAVAA